VIDYGKTAAGVTLTSLPIIIVFIIFQREFVRGLTAGALRG
jgi:ABC-type glycerol-3-phosphate transport system permease component